MTQHEIAVALLVRDGKVLLAHRHPARQWYPDCWDLLGGHVEPGETPREALIRECREEIGVDVTELRPADPPFEDPTLVVSTFLVTAWEGEPTNQAPDEHDDLRWFAPDELGDLVLADPGYAGGIPRVVREAQG